MLKLSFAIVWLVTLFSAFIAGVIGWGMNIATLFSGADMAWGEIVVRAIGIPLPIIGSVAGYF